MSESFLSGEQFDLPAYEGKPKTCYLICSTGRSGSTLLCDLLSKSGVAGVPHEYLHMAKHAKELSSRFFAARGRAVDLETYLREVIKRRTSSNGIFGLKAHPNQYFPLLEKQLIQPVFSPTKHIFIHRRDTVSQAISLAIAARTNSWTSLEESITDPAYDRADIDRCLGQVLQQNLMWTRYFELNCIEPFVIDYENLVQQPNAEIGACLRSLGVASASDLGITDARIGRQANSTNREWKERYLGQLKIH